MVNLHLHASISRLINKTGRLDFTQSIVHIRYTLNISQTELTAK